MSEKKIRRGDTVTVLNLDNYIKAVSKMVEVPFEAVVEEVWDKFLTKEELPQVSVASKKTGFSYTVYYDQINTGITIGDTVTVLSLDQYKPEARENVPFVGTLIRITSHPEYVIKSKVTEKEWHLYGHQIKELLTKEEIEESYPETIGIIPHGSDTKPEGVYGLNATYSKPVQESLTQNGPAVITIEWLEGLVEYLKKSNTLPAVLQVDPVIINTTDVDVINYAKSKGIIVVEYKGVNYT